MPHTLSHQCYLEARERPEIHPRQYEDLEAILRLLELIDSPPRSPDPPEPAQFRTPKLMIVDDDANISDMLQRGLIATGYPEEAIQVFSSAEDAIGHAKRSAVDIALVDIRLVSPMSVRGEYLSGLQVLQVIKGSSPAAKVILVTGFATYTIGMRRNSRTGRILLS
jgi:CheY-like chemotaxis protein